MDPSFSPDGRFLVFVSEAQNLIEDDSNGTTPDIFLYEITTGAVSLVSRKRGGNGSGDGASSHPSFSPDGRFIAFASRAGNLTEQTNQADVNGSSDVFLYNMETGTITLISVNRDGTAAGNDGSYRPVFEDEGRGLFFESDASDLIDNDSNQHRDLFRRDLESGKIDRANGDAGENNNNNNNEGDNAPNGNPVGFDFPLATSDPWNPIESPQGTYAGYQDKLTEMFYLHDAASGDLLLSIPTGAFPNVTFAEDESKLAFQSQNAELWEGDDNGSTDVFIRDMFTESTRNITHGGNHLSGLTALSGDGSTAVYTSFATNWIENDFNRQADLFLTARDIPSILDEDRDGLDDEWELDQFNDLNRTARVDSDGDGADNLHEFLAGTLANDPESVFAGRVLIPNEGGGIEVRWKSGTGEIYQVQYKDALEEEAWKILVESVEAEKPQTSVNDSIPNGVQARYYRILKISE